MNCVLQYLTNKVNKGEWPQIKDLTIVGDDVNRWRFKLYNFDNDMEGGRNLNEDLNVSCHWADIIYLHCGACMT